ncbi:MAG TPA: HIT domain-containing protein [Anaerolineales bacterium]|nr:HIT domain-containing protein [Anaerolineales bacterium]
MKHLWSPWRMRYITEFKKNGCVFCGALELEDGPENLIVSRGQKTFVILNAFPYTSGHLMVLPYQHVPDLSDLDAETRAEMMEMVTKSSQVLRTLYTPEGFNIGINMGEAAGAGIEEHIHIHIVPRWMGDTNFMTAVGQTRVLPEALDETYRRVKDAW